MLGDEVAHVLQSPDWNPSADTHESGKIQDFLIQWRVLFQQGSLELVDRHRYTVGAAQDRELDVRQFGETPVAAGS